MLDYSKLPEHGRSGFQDYFEHGYPHMGSFTQSVLENDLKGAFANADDFNVNLIREYVQWLYWEAPGGSWGSRENVAAWVVAKAKEREVAA